MHNLNMRAAIILAFAGKRSQISKLLGESLVWIEEETRIRRWDFSESRFILWAGKTGQLVATFRISQLPGCCGTVVLHYRQLHCLVKKQKKLAKLILQIQETACASARFTQLMATALENSPDELLYRDAGWVVLNQYINNKTNNTVKLFTKEIKHNPKPKKVAFGAEV